MDARLRYALLLTSAVLAVVVAMLLYKPEWLRGDKTKPDFSAYLRVEEPREILMDVFRSYNGESQVAKQLAEAGLPWTVERLHVEGTDLFQPYKIDTLTVESYRHLGFEGELSLEFFNNRLSTATFRPKQPLPYSRRLRDSGISLRKQALDRWEQQLGNRLITSNVIYATSNVGKTLDTPAFVRWEDTRLTAQARQWYTEHGSKTTVAPIKTTEPGSAP